MRLSPRSRRWFFLSRLALAYLVVLARLREVHGSTAPSTGDRSAEELDVASRSRRQPGKGQRKLLADRTQSVGEILLDMVVPSGGGGIHLGSSTVARPHGGPARPAAGVGWSSGSTGGSGQATTFALGAAATASLASSLEEAWQGRSRFRPFDAHHRPSPPLPDSASSPAPRDASDHKAPAVALSRLPAPPKGLMEGLQAARGKLPAEQPLLPPAPAATTSGGGSNATRPLLALIHPSTIAWPQRLDVAVAALVALETGDSAAGGFDVVVVLDTEGEPRSKHDCNAKATPMLAPVGTVGPGLNGGGKLLCDAKQLLDQAAVPSVVVRHLDRHHGGGKGGNKGGLGGGSSDKAALRAMWAAAVK